MTSPYLNPNTGGKYMRLKILGPLVIAGVMTIASAFGTTFANDETADADLTLSKEVSDDSVTVGDSVTFTLTVSNSGPATSTAVTLTDFLPAGLDFVSVASESGVPEIGPAVGGID